MSCTHDAVDEGKMYVHAPNNYTYLCSKIYFKIVTIFSFFTYTYKVFSYLVFYKYFPIGI